MKKTTIAISILAALLLGATAQADLITVSGEATLPSTNATLTINQDVTFTSTADFTGMLWFVFDEALPVNATEYGFIAISGLEYSINGGTPVPLTIWLDHLGSEAGDITENDGGLYNSDVLSESLFIGDTVTLHAGTGTQAQGPNGGFEPWESGDYDVFIAGDGFRISNNGVVPEPATAGLLGISAVVFYVLRRIKNFNRPV